MLTWRQRIIVILCAVLIGAGFGYLRILREGPEALNATPMAGLDLKAAFTLTDQNGKEVTEASWPGQYLLVYFGFTHCPDVCPTGLGKLTDALNALPADTVAKIQPLFITIDPARDTVKDMKAYVTLFHKKLIGLSGTQQQIDTVIKNFRVYAQKQTDPKHPDDKNYMMNHSSFTYLVAPDGQVIDVYSHDATAKDMAEKIKGLVK